MLHNAFDCILLLVNLQDMFSNVNENLACRRRGHMGTKHTSGNTIVWKLFIGSKTLTLLIYFYSSPYWISQPNLISRSSNTDALRCP